MYLTQILEKKKKKANTNTRPANNHNNMYTFTSKHNYMPNDLN